jgi:hypothetical protein
VAVVTTTSEKAKMAGPTRPLGAPEIPQFHLPASGKEGVYAPRLYGTAHVQFADRRRRLEETRCVAFLLPLEAGMRTVDWETAQSTALTPGDLLKEAPVAANYLPLPSAAMTLKGFTRWAKYFDRWLARTQKVEATTRQDPPETVSIGPKRGGVSVDLVAIVWELT